MSNLPGTANLTKLHGFTVTPVTPEPVTLPEWAELDLAIAEDLAWQARAAAEAGNLEEADRLRDEHDMIFTELEVLWPTHL